MTHLGKLIDRRLTEQSKTRVQFAGELGIVPVSVSRWLREEGDCQVPWRHYVRIAEVLGIPLARILEAAAKDSPKFVEMFHRFYGRSSNGTRRRH